MDTQLPAAWQPALDHSRYLRQLLQARPALIPELEATWQAPLSAEQLQAALAGPFADDDAVRAALRRLRHPRRSRQLREYL